MQWPNQVMPGAFRMIGRGLICVANKMTVPVAVLSVRAGLLKFQQCRHKAGGACPSSKNRRLATPSQRFAPTRKNNMSDCLHCDIHDLMESHLQSEDANLAEIAAKVTEVLADLILLAPPEERGTLIADVLVNLGEFVLQKGENGTREPNPRRH
jgi:hypothetical protein